MAAAIFTSQLRCAAAVRAASAAAAAVAVCSGAAHLILICGIVHDRRPAAVLLRFHVQRLLHGAAQLAVAQLVAVADLWQPLTASYRASAGDAVRLRVPLLVLVLLLMLLVMRMRMVRMVVSQRHAGRGQRPVQIIDGVQFVLDDIHPRGVGGRLGGVGMLLLRFVGRVHCGQKTGRGIVEIVLLLLVGDRSTCLSRHNHGHGIVVVGVVVKVRRGRRSKLRLFGRRRGVKTARKQIGILHQIGGRIGTAAVVQWRRRIGFECGGRAAGHLGIVGHLHWRQPAVERAAKRAHTHTNIKSDGYFVCRAVFR